MTDNVNKPEHYTNGGMECIDEMIMVFGPWAVMCFCVCNAWKYRRRAMYKNGEEDMQKSHWYMTKFKELKESAGRDSELYGGGECGLRERRRSVHERTQV